MIPLLLSTSQVTNSNNIHRGIAPPSTAAVPATVPFSIAAINTTSTSTNTNTSTSTTTSTNSNSSSSTTTTTTTTNTTPATTAATTTTTTVATTAPTAPTAPAAPTSTATPAPGPAALTGARTLKRPAASDLQRIAGTSATPSKRRATITGPAAGPSLYGARSIPNPPSASPRDPGRCEPPAFSHPQLVLQPSPAMMPAPAPAPITEDQLHGRTPEQLIATILQLQNQHQHFLAQINAQYESINQQLSELRGGLIASHHAAASAFTPRDQAIRSLNPPLPPVLTQQTAVPPPPRPPVQTPTRANPRVPPASPNHRMAPRSSLSAATPTTAVPPQYDYRTVATVEEVWKEYRQGMDGQPAIEKLDSIWGSRWRPEPRGRTWYSRRKVIWDKIKEFIAEGMDEDAAVQEVEKLRDGGTINKLIRMLQDDRKDKSVGEDGMAS
ncbi:transcriptional activator of glycolytic enzymes-domain-containing protein [Nemania sp. NC0429]|nr:transcriptional activator of glycolytic enzymes-domain-containing protein [Nemania sp. NC0429]